jgi:hypothetical protein
MGKFKRITIENRSFEREPLQAGCLFHAITGILPVQREINVKSGADHEGPSLKQIIEIGARSDLRRTWLI